MSRLARPLLVLASVALLASIGGHVSAAASRQPAARFVRVDQVGYAANEPKVAWLLTRTAAPGPAFRVMDTTGQVAFRGRTGHSEGRWNARFGAVAPLAFSALRAPGRYRIVVMTSPRVRSPWFRIASAEALLDPLIADGVRFFQAQRDGPDVISGVLDRQPAHLNDQSLQRYAWPTYENSDSDVIVGDLTALGETTDLAGGWVDAGDFIKFTHTTAYADALLWAAVRSLGAAAPASLVTEARFGLDWLRKTWHPATGVMDLQVGIGAGNQSGTILGDHDLWRLPEVDDTYPGAEAALIRHRPAFRANDPGSPLPPNLAGRVAAVFALAAQVDAATDPVLAQEELDTAAQILVAAKTTGVTAADVVTALPHAFYPESSWRDDMELGTAELALAGQALGDVRTLGWLRTSARWAAAYEGHEAGEDTLNLYDTSALAHADLVLAERGTADGRGGAVVGQAQLVRALRRQLDRSEVRAADDPFGTGVDIAEFDAVSHALGIVVTEGRYRELTGDSRFRLMATRQRDWVLGANAWGASFVIGAGSRFPHCPQHVVANLSGGLDGTGALLRGAVVNGPNAADLFADGLDEFFDEAHACPVDGRDGYARFTGHGSRFLDDVRAWQTVEPAIDFTATALLAFALSR